MHLKDLNQIFKGNGTVVNGALFSLYAFIGRGIGFLLLIVLANYIPPVDYGKLSLFNTVVMLIGFFAAFSTSGYFAISYFKVSKEVFNQDYSCIQVFLFLSLLIISVPLCLFGDALSSLVGIEGQYLWIAMFVAAFNTLFHMHQDYYRIKEKLKFYGILSLSNALFNAVFSLLLVISFSQGWVGRVNTQLAISLIYGLIAVLFFRHEGFRFDYNKERAKFILLWGLPQIPHLATNWIRQGCDQYIINYFYSTYEVGLFSFALNLVSIITMIGMAFNSSNSVAIFKILSNNNTALEKRNRLNKNTKTIFLVYLLSAVLILVFSHATIPFFLPQYSGSMKYLSILAIYGLGVCIYFLFCNYLFYYGYTKHLMYITFGTSLFHFLLSILLTRYSLFYTSIVYVISQALCVILVYWYSMRVLNQNIN